MTMMSLKTVKDLRMRILDICISTCYYRIASASSCDSCLAGLVFYRDGICGSSPPPFVCLILLLTALYSNTILLIIHNLSTIHLLYPIIIIFTSFPPCIIVSPTPLFGISLLIDSKQLGFSWKIIIMLFSNCTVSYSPSILLTSSSEIDPCLLSSLENHIMFCIFVELSSFDCLIRLLLSFLSLAHTNPMNFVGSQPQGYTSQCSMLQFLDLAVKLSLLLEIWHIILLPVLNYYLNT